MSATIAVVLMIASAPVDTVPDQAPVVAQAPDATPTPGLPSQTPAAAPAMDPQAASPAAAPATANLPSADTTGRDIVVVRHSGTKADPIAAINAESFQVVQAVDTAVIAPIAHGYEKIVPKPVRSGIHNVLNNLDEPIVFLNFLLQLKPGKAAETFARFAINTTLGVGGLVDVAKRKPFKLPRRSNGLADTLGYYGIGPGPYLFIPLIGATTVRDMLGRMVDLSVVPTAVGKPFNSPTYSLVKGSLASLDDRVERDDLLTGVKQSDDPYGAMRSWYLKKRKAEIDVLKGRCVSIDLPPCSTERAAPDPEPQRKRKRK